MRRMGSGLVDQANAAATRLPAPEPSKPEEETSKLKAGAETEPPGVATDETTRARPAVGPHHGRGESRA
jgi:hypothetical protein